MSTGIEWTDETWNPVTGCTKVSTGCDNCYAERVTERFHGKGSFANVLLHEDRLEMPFSWRDPRKVFANSMSDLFHADVPDEFIAKTFAVMALNPRHTFQILTKRPARMRALLNDQAWLQTVPYIAGRDFALRRNRAGKLAPRRGLDSSQITENMWPLPNVWLGVSVETQQWADIRIPALLDTPAAVRFLSCEPLLGAIDLRWRVTVPHDDAPRIHWVIAGGESGHGARPMHPDWARSLRDQCVAAGVPFLFKQWGEWGPERPIGWFGELPSRRSASHTFRPDGSEYRATEPDTLNEPCMQTVYRIGKKRAGRELDGHTWDEYPQAVTA